MDLDTLWIENEQKMDMIDKSYMREHSNMIKLFFIYIDDVTIEHVIKGKEVLESTCISKERLLQIIQNNRHYNDKKYRLDDLLLFTIDLEPENMQSFSELSDLTQMAGSFLKKIPIFEPIECSPSIFIFHDINSIYFLFNEIKKSAKSILKSKKNMDYLIRRKSVKNMKSF